MSLEATLIMLDNSAYSLNGDCLPTRWEAQVDAASLLIQAKL
jgi:26S proteasome regulatory subunit N10